MPIILLLKARAKWDTHTPDLFDAISQVHGYTRQDGTYVPPHTATRHHAQHQPHPHPMAVADVAKMSNNGPVNDERAKVESNPEALSGIPAAVASLTPGIPDEGARDYGLPNRRDIPEHLLPQVEAIIEKANRRAKKLGVEGFKLVKGEPFDRERKNAAGFSHSPKQFDRIIPCTIEGPTIKAPGGWSLAGRVDFEDGATIVNSKPGAELPPRYRSIRPTCEHCNSDRQRNAVFVFNRNGDDYMQVGRQCLKDYLGHDPAAALWAASEFGGIFDDIDREMEDEGAGGGNRAAQLVGLDDVMTAAAWAVREFGFVSKKAADERGVEPTSTEVSAALFDKKYRADYLKAVTQADKDKAAAVVAWVQSEWGSKADTSDYEYNAVELTSRRAVHVRRIGLLTSLVSAYDRATEEKVAREKRVNAHVGTVGERRDFEATFAGVNVIDTAYGALYIGRFDTPEGLVIYRGSTPFWDTSLRAGDKVRFTGTIAEHGEYKGTKQTKVSRAKILADGEVGVKPKKLIVRTEAVAA